MSEMTTRVDMTDEVGKFFNEKRPGGEVAITVPNLNVVARNGIICAGRLCTENSGCGGQAEWTERMDGTSFPVLILRASGPGSLTGSIGSLELPDRYETSVTSDFLENTSFHTDGGEPETLDARSQFINQMVRDEEVTNLIHRPAVELTGEEARLFVRVRDPLTHPLTIPSMSGYGRTRPVHNVEVSGLTVVNTENGRRVMVSVYDTPYQQVHLPPLPADALEFRVEPIKRTREWLLERLREVTVVLDQTTGLHGYVDELNSSLQQSAAPYYFRPAIPSNSGPDSTIPMVTAVLDGGEIGRYTICDYNFWDRTNYQLTRVVVHDGVLFAADEESGLALPLSQVRTSPTTFF